MKLILAIGVFATLSLLVASSSSNDGESVFIWGGFASLAVLKNQNRIAAGSNYGVIIYDIATKKDVLYLEPVEAVLALLPFKQNQLIQATPTGVLIFNSETGQLLKKLSERYGQGIDSIALSKDQSFLVGAGRSDDVTIWDMNTFEEVKSFEHGHKPRFPVRSVILDETRGLVITGSYDRTIRVHNLNDGSLVRELTGHTDWINKLLLDEQTGLLYSSASDGTIKVWDIEAGTELRTLVGHDRSVYDLIFSEDGQRLVSASGDGKIIVWDKKSGNALNIISRPNNIPFNLAFGPSGQLISTSDGFEIIFWSTKP